MIAGSLDPNCCWGGKDNVDACNRQGACNVAGDVSLSLGAGLCRRQSSGVSWNALGPWTLLSTALATQSLIKFQCLLTRENSDRKLLRQVWDHTPGLCKYHPLFKLSLASEHGADMGVFLFHTQDADCCDTRTKKGKPCPKGANACDRKTGCPNRF